MSSSSGQWPLIALGDLVEILDSQRIPISAKERANRPGDVPYYGATGQVGTIDNALFDEPLLLLGEDGVQFFDSAKRKAYLVDGPSWVNNHAHVLRVGRRVNRKFLNYYLNCADYRGFVNGTTRLKLTQAAMRRLPVPTPPLDVQCHIVDLLEGRLSRLDSAESLLDHAMRRAEAMVISSLDRLTTIEDSCARSTVGAEARLVEYGSSAKTQLSNDSTDIPVLRMGNIQRGALDWGSLKYLPADHDEFPRLLLERGDLLFNRTNSAELVGKSAVFSQPRTASFASYLIRVRFGDRVDARWAAMVINSPAGRRYIGSVVSQQVGQANVNGTKLKAFPLPVPPLSEQVDRIRDYEAVVAARDRLCAGIDRSAVRAAALRRAVLNATFLTA